MEPGDLQELSDGLQNTRRSLLQRFEALPASDPNDPNSDHEQDEIAEAIFLRSFTFYEKSVERLFLHYVCGGETLDGRPCHSFIQNADEAKAKAIIRAGWRFISWSKPSSVRDLAAIYLQHGWPVVDVLATRSQTLSDCEKIRNRIAHDSAEAAADFAAVQRNNFATERIFPMTPGHLLRARHARKRQTLIISDYISSLLDTGEALLTPPI